MSTDLNTRLVLDMRRAKTATDGRTYAPVAPELLEAIDAALTESSAQRIDDLKAKIAGMWFGENDTLTVSHTVEITVDAMGAKIVPVNRRVS